METVPSNVSLIISILGILSILIPFIVFYFVHKKTKASFKSLIVGGLVMFVFALTIESLIHQLVFQTSIGKTIQGNILLYALYGGFMAALFEETGRYLAFQTVLKKDLENDGNALGYGIGHGGIEMIMIYGFTMIGNLVMINMINNGSITSLLAQSEELEPVIATLIETPASYYLLGFMERISAFLLQIALSIFVWIAVKKKRFHYYLLAFMIHFLVDACVVLLVQNGMPLIVFEILLFIVSLGILWVSKKKWNEFELKDLQ